MSAKKGKYSLHPFPGYTRVVLWPQSSSGVRYMDPDYYDEWLRSIGEKAPKPLEVLEVKPGKCDCGSAVAGSSRHSTWCSAYEK